MTKKQKAIYEFIVERVRRRGIPPTLNEIGTAFGLSSASGVADHLNALERKGYIRRRPGISRGIELLGESRTRPLPTVAGQEVARIPVLGSVPGPTRLTRKRPRGGHLLVDQRVMPGAAMAVRVEIDAKADHGIFRGDYLILGKDRRGRPGNLAVARHRDGTALVEILSTGGRVRRIDNQSELRDGYEILGEVLAILRSMNGTDREDGSR
jgi:repressor LexA